MWSSKYVSNPIYCEEYTRTGYKFATREFIIESRGRPLPDDLIKTDIEFISEKLGIDLTRIREATVTYNNGTMISFIKLNEPIKKPASIEIMGEKFVIDYTEPDRYVHHKYHEITYDPDEKIIRRFSYPYGTIEIPDNYPITSIENLHNDVHNELIPHLPKDGIKFKKRKRGIFVEIETDTYSTITAVRRYGNKIKYSAIPLYEGIYELTIPDDLEFVYDKLMSVHDLPDDVKTKQKKKFADEVKYAPDRIKYAHDVEIQWGAIHVVIFSDMKNGYVMLWDDDFVKIESYADLKVILENLYTKPVEEALEYIRAYYTIK